MLSVWRCLYADWYQMKHTSFLWLHLGLPCMWCAVYLAYIYGRPPEVADMYMNYMQMLGIVLPLLSSLICGMVAAQESQAGHFQNVLIRTRLKEMSYVSKLLFVWGCGSLAVLLAAVLLGVGASLVLNIHHLPYELFIKGALYLALSSGILYVIHLWISFTWGMGASILAGGAGTLVAALMITSIGDSLWHYIPWAWSARMVSSEAMLTMGILTEPYSLYLEQDIQKGWIWVVSVTMAGLILSLIWFRYWDGGRANE